MGFNSTDMYRRSARKATADGHRPGSHAWWDAIRFYNGHELAWAGLINDPPSFT